MQHTPSLVYRYDSVRPHLFSKLKVVKEKEKKGKREKTPNPQSHSVSTLQEKKSN
jgi:hypothetical protein